MCRKLLVSYLGLSVIASKAFLAQMVSILSILLRICNKYSLVAYQGNRNNFSLVAETLIKSNSCSDIFLHAGLYQGTKGTADISRYIPTTDQKQGRQLITSIFPDSAKLVVCLPSYLGPQGTEQ